MPFKSQSQRAYLYSQHPEIAKRWSKEYPNQGKLPEHVGDKEAAKKKPAVRKPRISKKKNKFRKRGFVELLQPLQAELQKSSAYRLPADQLATHLAVHLRDLARTVTDSGPALKMASVLESTGNLKTALNAAYPAYGPDKQAALVVQLLQSLDLDMRKLALVQRLKAAAGLDDLMGVKPRPVDNSARNYGLAGAAIGTVLGGGLVAHEYYRNKSKPAKKSESGKPGKPAVKQADPYDPLAESRQRPGAEDAGIAQQQRLFGQNIARRQIGMPGSTPENTKMPGGGSFAPGSLPNERTPPSATAPPDAGPVAQPGQAPFSTDSKMMQGLRATLANADNRGRPPTPPPSLLDKYGPAAWGRQVMDNHYGLPLGKMLNSPAMLAHDRKVEAARGVAARASQHGTPGMLGQMAGGISGLAYRGTHGGYSQESPDMPGNFGEPPPPEFSPGATNVPGDPVGPNAYQRGHHGYTQESPDLSGIGDKPSAGQFAPGATNPEAAPGLLSQLGTLAQQHPYVLGSLGGLGIGAGALGAGAYGLYNALHHKKRHPAAEDDYDKDAAWRAQLAKAADAIGMQMGEGMGSPEDPMSQPMAGGPPQGAPTGDPGTDPAAMQGGMPPGQPGMPPAAPGAMPGAQPGMPTDPSQMAAAPPDPSQMGGMPPGAPPPDTAPPQPPAMLAPTPQSPQPPAQSAMFAAQGMGGSSAMAPDPATAMMSDPPDSISNDKQGSIFDPALLAAVKAANPLTAMGIAPPLGAAVGAYHAPKGHKIEGGARGGLAGLGLGMGAGVGGVLGSLGGLGIGAGGAAIVQALRHQPLDFGQLQNYGTAGLLGGGLLGGGLGGVGGLAGAHHLMGEPSWATKKHEQHATHEE